MDEFVMPLPVALDVVSLTMGLVNIESPTGAEPAIAASIHQALEPLPHLTVERLGNTVVARTELGHGERTVFVGHLGTDPVADEPLAYVEMGKLFGPGACDAKGGLAVMLKSATLDSYTRDATFVFHADLDELARQRADLLRGDRAVVVSPTNARVEARTEPALDDGRLRLLADLGLPAQVFGPGDPDVAHTPEEFVPTAQLTECEHELRQWLQA